MGSSKLVHANLTTAALALLLVMFVVAVASTGCSRPKVPQADKYEPPSEFQDSDGSWSRVDVELSERDERWIGGFFEDNPELVDSPDWNGSPVVYERQGSSSTRRAYWFSISVQKVHWNALEWSGGSVEELTGEGKL